MAFRRGPRLIMRARNMIRSAWILLGCRSASDFFGVLRPFSLTGVSFRSWLASSS